MLVSLALDDIIIVQALLFDLPICSFLIFLFLQVLFSLLQLILVSFSYCFPFFPFVFSPFSFVYSSPFFLCMIFHIFPFCSYLLSFLFLLYFLFLSPFALFVFFVFTLFSIFHFFRSSTLLSCLLLLCKAIALKLMVSLF